MVLPVSSKVAVPAVLAGQQNGRLPASLLTAVKMPGGGRDLWLVEPAARCFRAMVAHAAADGLLLMCTQGYRSYAEQEALFRDRFRTYDTGRRPEVVRTWLDRRWWLRKGVALAAVPGTSNHGRGIAADLSEQLDGDPAPESISDRAVAWLVAHAHLYGISAEVQSEPWHWRCYIGDAIPAAVLEYESTEVDDMTPEERETLNAMAWRVHALVYGESPLRTDDENVPKSVRGEVNWTVEQVKAVAAATKRAAVTVDAAAVAAELVPLLEAAVGARIAALEAKVDRLIASEKAQADALGE